MMQKGEKKKMLCFKNYSRAELVQLFGTNRIDAIKNKLDRDGYDYTACGRGNDLIISITGCTKPFEVFCKEELNIPAQTNIDRLKKFLKRLFFDDKFARLPFAAMEREVGISCQTISKWIKILVAANLITLSNGEYIYYISRRVNMDDLEIIDITEQQYKDAWAAYWEGRDDGYFLSVNRLYNINEGTPHKRGMMIENAFEKERMEKLRELLRSK